VLASGSGDKTIKLWDVASLHELRTLPPKAAAAIADQSVRFGPETDVEMVASDFGLERRIVKLHGPLSAGSQLAFWSRRSRCACRARCLASTD
jgi:hypothetical protein